MAGFINLKSTNPILLKMEIPAVIAPPGILLIEMKKDKCT
jgi:hypothetical protein